MRIFFVALLLSLSSFTTYNVTDKKDILTELELIRLNDHVKEVKSFTASNYGYSRKIAFLVDMKIKSGKNRFFVYDLENEKIIDQGLVAHGSGSETGIKGDILQFSNMPNSNCTSLGRYSVEKPYKGVFGKAFRLAGLDETNSNALKRAIVLHCYKEVPDEEKEYYIINSHGCPMVSEVFFKRLEKIIDSSDSKIMLSVYY
ncbi:L,D-transpeptidase catalytic domain [Flavobacterium sp. CF108]|uniref:murein L,D-transpeptidase catalytic domain-containing protein n=1 Tax=unclassified Flavobacterium TaxID=196869 RepID=UPI0008D194D6|nr:MULTISPECIES: murein L,D-transpeptidase catalytic domain family protein [unclassified Flavobacterium]SEO18024.1 L,D-transpeptidase catalytic domain [Flavobacterium sp. fv08]SHG55203.1 L,D-transpeptidase catalytic domain [Flavobacterium sp. CF108]